MSTRPRTTSKGSRSNGKPPKGGAANGTRRNGNRANGKNGVRANGNGSHANGNGAVTTVSPPPTNDEARRIATTIGGAMLVASSLETAKHSDDVELIADAISDHLGLSDADRADVQAGARLHDIGKASISRELLDKPAALTESEWEVMRTHTIVGAEILGSVKELKGIASLVRHSHERWDGHGYPDGLAGEDIPLGSRIIFCADAFHAIRSDRPYRQGVSAAAAWKEVQRCAGTQFDPMVVEALEQVIEDLSVVPRPRRGKRSSRLTALLLCLALGGGGGALAGSGLLGEPDPAVGATQPAFDCPSLYCHFLYPSATTGLAIGAERFGGPPQAAPGPGRGPLAVTPGGKPITGGSGGAGAGTIETGQSRPGGQGESGDAPAGGADEGGGSGGEETTPSGGGDPPSPAKGDKNPNSPGNGWGPPSTRPEGSAAPGNGGGNGGGPPSGNSAPGNSGNAPGHNKPPKPPKT